MNYQAVCTMHPEFAPDACSEYADAVSDLQAHQAEQHFLGVITIEDEPPVEEPES